MIQTLPGISTLSERLRERIRRGGPITFYDFMQSALYDEREGYYCRPDATPWGREGDYRTSPERSTLFSSSFARYFASLFDKLERPREWTIVEVGGGDGAFAEGVLKTLADYFPAVFSATSYIFDERSSAARSRTHKRLEPFVEKFKLAKLSEMAVNPGIVFSNELLDAFPVHRIIRQHGRLRELYVDLMPDGAFGWISRQLFSEAILSYLEENEITLADGQTVEVSLDIEEWFKQASRAIKRGYLITVDYGAPKDDLYSASERPLGTLRGFSRHRIVESVLANPGEQDLTTTVNWSWLRQLGRRVGLETIGFERQDKFLLAAGLLEQLQIESERGGDEAESLRLSTAAREMILPTGMAGHFQVLVQERV